MSTSRSENRDSGTAQPKKPPSSSATAKPPQDQQTLKCPRCNSPNTKFCYYNNYSLSQPRHFCKTCRRYWTRGGALRNVPIGGGCRKTRRAAVKPASNSSLSSCSTTSTSSSSSSRFFLEDSKFFHGGLVSPTMDFQLAGLSLNKIVNLNPNFPGGGGTLFNENNNNNLQLCSSSSFGDQTTAVDGGSGLSLMGFGDYPVTNPAFSSGAGTGSVAGGVDGNLASSIETLSSLNQDLHWKLQQQRMAMLFGSKEATTATNGSDHGGVPNSPVERPQPILFRNLDMEYSSRKEEDSGETSTTEWYFGNSAYAPNNNNYNPVGAATTNDGWHGVHQAANWTDLNQFNALP